MNKNEYSVLGLMSGTSLDGLDMAHVHFRLESGLWSFELVNKASLDYQPELREKLKNSLSLPGLDLLTLDKEYGAWLGSRVREFLEETGASLDFVSSHGHTVFHQLDKKLTYQIGDGQELANTSGQVVVNNFRTLDVSLGGQGAPLVPMGDALLFSTYDFRLNLGGIANVSFNQGEQVIAFDITVANMLLNHLVEEFGKTYDENGSIARSGQKDKVLFQELNSLEYCHAPFPKSTGYEWFVDEVLPVIQKSTISTEDKLCTAVHHIGYQIAAQLPTQSGLSNAKMLSTGGGTRNQFLFETIQAYLGEGIELVNPGSDLIDYKESIVFALLGVLRMRNEPNCLASVTGASHDNCGGQIFYPGGIS